MPNDISLKEEIQRKLIHLASGIIPILVLIYGKDFILPKLALITVIFVFIDFFKSKLNWMLNVYKFFFKTISREHELNCFTGASWLLLGDLFVLSIFPESIAVFSMFLLSISDSFAAIFGKYFGETKLFLKTLEGSFAFLISGFLIAIFFQEIPLSLKIITVVIATITEALPLKVSDNLIIPVLSASVCYLGINII
jgi:diacylglycerol kinase (CTP)